MGHADAHGVTGVWLETEFRPLFADKASNSIGLGAADMVWQEL